MRIFNKPQPNGRIPVWVEEPKLPLSQRLTARYKALINHWRPGVLIEYSAPNDATVWLRWHSMVYRFDRVVEVESNIDLLRVVPAWKTAGTVLTSDDHAAFAGANTSNLYDLLDTDTSSSGTRFFVRQGEPRPAVYYRIPIYGTRVTLKL